MGLKRGMLSTYLLVFGGLAIGIYVGVFVIDYHPAVFAWLFGAGAGLSVGSFIAAITSGIPLVGNPGTGTPYRRLDAAEDFDDDWRDPRDR